VAAGWAIDLFVGRERREHEDLEIAIPAGRLSEFLPALAGFEVYAVKVPGKATFTPLAEAGDGLRETHQTWVRDPASGDWRLDLFREPGDGDTWICRRDERIRLPYDEVIAHTADGIPYARPEVILLYKAKHSREKDEADFAAVLPHLDAEARARLAGWLDLVHPGHRWLAELG
jgi:Aminoglycoside-2''-adenylyltransferase